MSNALVSVVVPAFNHEEYVVECLQSIYDQTYKRIELIFVDDVSTDATLALARELFETPFQDRFERILVQTKQENSGAHDSINIGIEAAQGDYIAIINSDDLFHPARLDWLVGEIESQDGSIAFSICQPLRERNEETDASLPIDLLYLPMTQVHICAQAFSIGYALLRQNVAVTTGNFVFRRDLVDRIGPFTPLKYCHDWDFILQATTVTEPIFVPEPLYLYRIHPRNSFHAYKGLARRETELVRERFFKTITNRPPTNMLCPSPERHTGMFQMFLSELNILDVWRAHSKRKVEWQRTYEMFGRKRATSYALKEALEVAPLDSSYVSFTPSD